MLDIQIIDGTQNPPPYGWDIYIDQGPLANKAGYDYAYWLTERVSMEDKSVINAINAIIDKGVAYRKLRLVCTCGDLCDYHASLIKNIITPYIEEILNAQQPNNPQYATTTRYKSRQVDGVWW